MQAFGMMKTQSINKNVQEFVKEEFGIDFPIDPEDVCLDRFSLYTIDELKCFGFTDAHCEKIFRGLADINNKKDGRLGRLKKQTYAMVEKARARGTFTKPELPSKFKLETDEDVTRILASHNTEKQLDEMIDYLSAPSNVKMEQANSTDLNIHSLVFLAFDSQVQQWVANNSQNVDVLEVDDWTPLHFAMAIGCTDVAVTMVNSGANLHARTRTGETPIELGAKWGHRNTMGRVCLRLNDLYGKALTQELVNVIDSKNRQPIHHAAEARHFEACDVLLMFGADPNTKDKNGNTALFLACKNGDIATIDNLVHNKFDKSKNGNLHVANNNGVTPFDVFPRDKSLLDKVLSKHS
ncbi:Ankyrin repeat domain-containing protein 26-like protein [Aphelenchoides besseyi]|nr:Ankyrin repeat domain-containing protein 26-like protein [Aphelenchoides besseyi]KAI6194649.1 Ankyrin repeat domain-containing protein 26-like protein [Aphelenchoides besseyi]